MDSVILLFATIILATPQTSASLPPLPVNPGGIGGLFRGPNSETIIKGPDGSQITSEQLGGAIQTGTKLGTIIVPDQIAVPSIPLIPDTYSDNIVVQNNVPIDSQTQITGINHIQNNVPIVSPTPIITVDQIQSKAAELSEVLTLAQPLPNPLPAPATLAVEDPHIIETELVDAPEIEPNQNSDLKGPSGTISVRGSTSIVSGPASTTISEPVRKIPIAAIPVGNIVSQHQPMVVEVAAPSTILTPPPQIGTIGHINTLNVQPIVAHDQPPNIVLRTDLLPPLVTNSETPLISLTGTSGAGIADVNPVLSQLPAISSTPTPQIAIQAQNNIGLGQQITSSSQPVIDISSNIDISKINLGQSQVQQDNIAPEIPAQLNGQTIVSSTISPLPVSGDLNNVQRNNALSLSNQLPINPLLTTSIDIQNATTISSSNTISNPNLLSISDELNRRFNSQNNVILSQQIESSTPGYTAIDNRNIITSGQRSRLIPTNIDSRHWLNIQSIPQSVSSTISPNIDRSREQNIAPVASVLDTVLVQPTDPRNREVIEFGGKQLENVGNIVPVVNNPILFATNLNNVQQIPTASISQLSSRNDLDPNIYNRYGRDAKKKN